MGWFGPDKKKDEIKHKTGKRTTIATTPSRVAGQQCDPQSLEPKHEPAHNRARDSGRQKDTRDGGLAHGVEDSFEAMSINRQGKQVADLEDMPYGSTPEHLSGPLHSYEQMTDEKMAAARRLIGEDDDLMEKYTFDKSEKEIREKSEAEARRFVDWMTQSMSSDDEGEVADAGAAHHEAARQQDATGSQYSQINSQSRKVPVIHQSTQVHEHSRGNTYKPLR